MITEGVIPIAAVDPIRVIISCTLGAAVGGGLSMTWGIGSPVSSIRRNVYRPSNE